MSRGLIRLALDVAATWRATRLIVEDEITRELREAVGSWAADQPDSVLREKLRYLVTCPYCVSVWVGLGIAFDLMPRRIRDALALSAGSLAVTWAAENLERPNED